MTDLTPLIPRRPVPPLSVPLLGGGTFALAERRPQNFTLVVFYRGLHCPICRAYLTDLQARLDDFAARGVDVVAISSDAAERAERTRREWRLDRLAIGHSLDLRAARAWGLYISTSRGTTSAGVEEPALFSEPGEGHGLRGEVVSLPERHAAAAQ